MSADKPDAVAYSTQKARRIAAAVCELAAQVLHTLLEVYRRLADTARLQSAAAVANKHCSSLCCIVP